MKLGKQTIVRKNDEFVLKIEGLTGEGQGIGRIDGFVVFVLGALPGESVKVHVIKATSSFAIAVILEYLSQSPDRILPRCPVYERCGGCTLQHLKYDIQLKTKRQQVIDALERLGGIPNPPVKEMVGMENPWGYRNKGAFPFGKTQHGNICFGFFSEHSHRMVPISDCLIQDERTIHIVRKIAAWAEENGISAYEEQTGRGSLRHVMVRVTSEGETMAVIVTKGPLKAKDQLVEALSDVDSVYHNRNDDATNVILGKTNTLLSGKTSVEEKICGHLFQIGPQSFLQTNPVQTEKLYQIALEMATENNSGAAMDLYCGIGTISLLLAEHFTNVIGIEIVEPAVEDARRNAERNKISNASFIHGDVGEVLPSVLEKEGCPDVVILDPPRKGCETSVLKALVQNRIERIVYISCNPATLARDAAVLKDGGFNLIQAVPVDMFPHTSHVETIVLLQRQNS